jgi:hypothetical protein
MWFGSPQTGNPGDRYTIGQNSDQHSSDNAEQVIRIFTNCDSDGTCIGQEDATQNGNHESNSCSGTSCHIETVCGGFETEAGGCFTTSECDGDCGNPPPSPSPPPPPVNVCELEVCIG